MMCDDCIHAGRVTGFPDGDMFVCEGIVCPCYKKVEE